MSIPGQDSTTKPLDPAARLAPSPPYQPLLSGPAAWLLEHGIGLLGRAGVARGQAATGSGEPPCAGTFTPERSSAPVTIAPAAKIAAAHQKAVT